MLDNDEDIMLIFYMMYVMYFYVYSLNLQQLTRRRWWVRNINKDRYEVGYYNTTYKKIRDTDPEEFFKHTRMDRPVLYELLLSLVKDKLTKKSIRTPIDFECRLALTLTYLSQGVSYQFLAWSFHMGKSTVREIILETCEVLWEVLSPLYVSPPNGAHFKEIAKNFEEKWNMPNCVGAIDGKHINIQCPPNSGSMFFNYKKTFSIVLMAICDANYCFTHVDVGAYGSQSDGEIFQNSPVLGQSLLSGQLPLPEDKNLPSTSSKFPFYFVGDAAFPLKRHIMRPFPGRLLSETRRIINYSLSRAGRTLDNSFGILVARWRILKTTLHCIPDNAEKITLACIALHNFELQK